MTQINERMRRRDKDAAAYAIAQEATNSIAQTLANLKCNRNGLTQDDADERLEQFGANQVAHDKAPHALIQLIKAFNNPFIFVLMVLAAISFFTDYWLPRQNGEETELTGVIIILTMVTLSGLLRFWQEYRTNKAAEALKSMVRTTATVLRRSSYSAHPLTLEVPIRELVPGDIIQLSAGDMVPADVRLIASRDLFISQAILTGEAIPIEKYDAMGNVAQKSSEGEVSSENALLELSNICLMGTNVASGTATAVVVATGGRTYFGSLAKSRRFAGANRVRSRGEQRQLAADSLHAGDGAGGVADQRFHQRRLERGGAVRTGGGGRSDAGNVADDRQLQPGERGDRHVAPQGGGEAPERHSELRRHGRALHRQDRHADPGSHHSRAPHRRHWRQR